MKKLLPAFLAILSLKFGYNIFTETITHYEKIPVGSRGAYQLEELGTYTYLSFHSVEALLSLGIFVVLTGYCISLIKKYPILGYFPSVTLILSYFSSFPINMMYGYLIGDYYGLVQPAIPSGRILLIFSSSCLYMVYKLSTTSDSPANKNKAFSKLLRKFLMYYGIGFALFIIWVFYQLAFLTDWT